MNRTSSDPALGPPVQGWLPPQLPPLEALSGRFCRVEPIDSTRHGEPVYAAYAADREDRLCTYLPWGPYSETEELCAQIDAVRDSGLRPEYALIDLASGKSRHCWIFEEPPGQIACSIPDWRTGHEPRINYAPHFVASVAGGHTRLAAGQRGEDSRPPAPTIDIEPTRKQPRHRSRKCHND